MRQCFTYLIGWSDLNTYYYGRKTSKKCHPSMLFDTYFTSSTYVHQFIKQHGMPDIIQIRKTFGEDYKSCEQWELTVLQRINAAGDSRYLNKTNVARHSTSNRAVAYDKNQQFIGMISCSDERWGKTIFGINKFKDTTRWHEGASKKMREMAKNGTHPSQVRVANRTHHFQRDIGNRPGDIKQRQLVQSGDHHWQSESHKKEVSQRTKRLISEGRLPAGQKTTCPHCDKSGQTVAMKRWHFDNCKFIDAS